MELPVIQIGNSKGLILSDDLLERYNIKDSVEIILEEDYIIIKAKPNPRKGWDKAFKEMHENGDDQLL
jgi:antitoxin MazE